MQVTDLIIINKAVFLCMYSVGPVPALLIIETILEQIAQKLNKHPIDVKELNLYQKDQVYISQILKI